MERPIAALAEGLAAVAVGALLLLAVVVVVDVLGRYLFAAPLRGLVDISTLATAIIAAACFPALVAARANMTLRPFARFGRLARVLDRFGAIVTALFLGLMAWQYVRYAAEMTSSGERTATLRWPVGPWWWTVTVMITLAAIVAVLLCFTRPRGTARPDDPREA